MPYWWPRALMGVGMPSRIVDRYKTLICSIAYSATGNFSQSEDVAQETFISAWKDLRHLREPSKLRAWLCGIVRNQIQRDIRKGRRDPVQNAVLLEDASKSPTADELPSAQAVSREEEAILWRSLERIPENFREPLVLFYRERKSVEHVAAELELSEDAVRQRLSRGRKLLQEEVQAFVENTLRRTAPGQAFSGDVIGALPLATGTAASASIGLGAKGKAAALSGLLSAWIVPLLGIAAGFASQWVLFPGGADERGHRANRSPLIVAWVLVLSFCFGGQQIMRLLGNHFEWDNRTFFCAMSGFWLFYAMVIATWIISVLQARSGRNSTGPREGGRARTGRRADESIHTHAGYGWNESDGVYVGDPAVVVLGRPDHGQGHCCDNAVAERMAFPPLQGKDRIRVGGDVYPTNSFELRCCPADNQPAVRRMGCGPVWCDCWRGTPYASNRARSIFYPVSGDLGGCLPLPHKERFVRPLATHPTSRCRPGVESIRLRCVRWRP